MSCRAVSITSDVSAKRSAITPIYCLARTDFHNEIVKKPLTWDRGYLLAPEEPGLGIELNEKCASDHPYKTGGPLHLEMCQTVLPSDNKKIITELQKK